MSMTLGCKRPSRSYANYFSIKDSINSFLIKLEVISDSDLIVNSVRILIVVLALLMGYIHTPNEKKDISSAADSVFIDNNIKPIIEQVN